MELWDKEKNCMLMEKKLNSDSFQQARGLPCMYKEGLT